ncbi:ABC transporter ATP-binding protein [Boudabousia liubingyangii]|uniref:ABC transporter ATP-binding protein n=1 Tax=Boudabousia liubingyangii TaxID=1921764 RepID=UPI0030B80327
MSGMDLPSEGSVEYLGEEITALTEPQMSKVRLLEMGFVFQQPYFLENLSLRDNILLPAVKSGKFNASQAESRVDELLARFEIAHVADHGISQVSGGQLQRAAICRALVNSPAVLFVDEPTGALNSNMTQEFLDVLGEVHRLGTAIIMVTHDPVCAARADRIIYLKDGCLVDEHRMDIWNPRTEAGARIETVRAWLKQNDF